MLAEELSKDAMFLAAAQFERFFDNDKVTQALQLFHNGLVYNINIYAEREISAIVQDRHPYNTVFSLNNPDESLCDCEKQVPCEHIWTAFFANGAGWRFIADWGIIDGKVSEEKTTKCEKDRRRKYKSTVGTNV